MPANRSIAFVLLNWNHARETIACAESLLAWRNLRPRVVVVDNASAPADRDLLADALASKAVLAFNDANEGFAGGCNRGIRLALDRGADVVALHNYDATTTEDDVLRLLAVFNAHPRVGAVCPLLRETDGDRHATYAGGRDIARHDRTRRPAAEPPPPGGLEIVDYVPGALALFRSVAFERCGLLDESYFFSGEIADFCAAMKTAGMECAVAYDAVAVHSLGQSAHRNALYAYYSFRNRFLFIRKHFPLPTAIALQARWSARIAAAIAGAALARNAPQARALALAWRDGLAGRWGNRNRLFIAPPAP
jgi:GT2 family glycosyltransferase